VLISYRLLPRRIGVALAVGIIATVVTVICVTDSAANARASTPRASKFVGPLTIALSSQSDLPIMVAYGAGLFQRDGLDTTFLQNQGTLVTTEIASGEADVTEDGTGASLLLSAGGSPSVIINAVLGGGAAAAVAVSTSQSAVESMADLSALGTNCTIVTTPVGTTAFGDTTILEAHDNIHCKIVQLASPPAAAGELVAGDATAWIGSPIILQSTVSAGEAKYIFNSATQKTLARKVLGPPYVEGVDLVSASTIARKKPELVAFEKAIQQARVLIAKDTPTQLYTRYLLPFFPTSEDTEATALVIIGTSKEFQCGGTVDCYISKSDWNYTLSELAQWGLPNYSATNPLFSYQTAVNSSFYKDANGVPHTAKPKKKKK
jgi:hypothetical protein